MDLPLRACSFQRIFFYYHTNLTYGISDIRCLGKRSAQRVLLL